MTDPVNINQVPKLNLGLEETDEVFITRRGSGPYRVPASSFPWERKGDPGAPGGSWAPVLSLVTDGVRRVHRIVGWVGGTGVEPTTTGYIGAAGIVSNVAEAVDVRGLQGNAGWAPVLALVADGDRRVHQVIDWAGGAGAKPGVGWYVGATGLVELIQDAVNVRGATGGVGWSPVLAVVPDGNRRVQQIVDWIGGAGTKPTALGYVGTSGIVATAALAADVSGAQGNAGWAPVLAIVADGERRVQQVMDWTGGAGTKPETLGYVGDEGLVSTTAAAVDVRGPQGVSGWAPVLAIVADGERRVQRVVDWTGGAGAKPETLGYIGAAGIVATAAAAVDVRGSGAVTSGSMLSALTTAPASDLAGIGHLVSGVVPVSLNSAGSAAGNRAAIMASLASSGRAVIAGKSTDVCWISQHITVGDNQTLITDGPQIKMQAGVSDYVVGTLAEETVYSSVTVIWTAGRQATVAWSGHGCVYGDAVVLQGTLGTTYRQWFDVARVIGVTDANNITIALEWLPTAAPSGAMTAKRCNRNINIRARLNHNYSGGNNGSGRTRMASVMSFIADSNIDIISENDTAKYVCLLAGAININGQARGIPETTSDTLKYYGPMRNVSIHVRGNCSHEDCASVQPYEPAQFVAYMPCYGEINGVTIERPEAHTGGGSGAIVLYGDTIFGVSGVNIRGGRAISAGATPGLHLRFGEGTPASELYGDINVIGTQIASDGASAVRVQSFKARSLNFIGAKIQPPKDNTLRVLDMNNTSVLRRLLFRDMDIDLGAWPSVTWQAILLDGSVDSVIFDNCSIRGGASLRFLFCNGFSSVRSIRFQGCDVRGIDQLVNVQTGASVAPRISIDGGYYELNTLVGSKVSGVVVDVSAGTVINNALNGVLRYDTASTSGVLIDRGMSLQGTSVALTGVNGGTVELRGPNTPFALNNAALKRTAGAECIAAAAAGTIPAGAPVICDGTSWYSRVNPSLSYP